MIKSKPLGIVLILLLSVIAILVALVVLNHIEKQIYPKKYRDLVEIYSKEYNVPENIIYATIKVESNFREDATSSAGAKGLMQLMPSTYEWLCDKAEAEEKSITAPEENVRYGTYYLSILYEKYRNWEYVFAAYNAGSSNVDNWLSKEEYGIEFPETKNYVDKMLNTAQKYKKLYY